MSDRTQDIRLFCVSKRVVEIHVFLVVIHPRPFTIGRTEVRQKVGSIQVFYDELTVREYLLVIVGHDLNARFSTGAFDEVVPSEMLYEI